VQAGFQGIAEFVTKRLPLGIVGFDGGAEGDASGIDAGQVVALRSSVEP